eukprot:TRINITY_DN6147_c1_g1_i1.p1 TRINITY_DN6147_c1_g1~~TRINITY_DN6147_c1_g1_i1.p1  ORF type:complete len:911 (+),score=145.89 TRINITY_DN6147_c1_g1_i1:65-2734(+)
MAAPHPGSIHQRYRIGAAVDPPLWDGYFGRYCCFPSCMQLPGDTKEMLRGKMWFLCTYSIIGAGAFIGYALRRDAESFLMYSWVGTLAASVLIILGGIIYRRLLPKLLVMAVVLTSVALMMRDAASAARGNRTWTTFVVIIDLMLVLRVPRWITVALVAVVCIWVTLMELELGYRFGLLDSPGMLDYEDRRRIMCCEKPPCAHGEATSTVGYIATKIFVLVADFLLTRGFADTVAQDKEAMAKGVETTQVVASCLASYDLEAAKRHLVEAGEELPGALQTALQEILHNLEIYRLYLPHDVVSRAQTQSADPVQTEQGSNPLRPPLPPRHRPRPRADDNEIPGMDGCAAVASLSVRQAEVMWECCGDALQDALVILRQCVRSAAREHGGYEVQGSGDSFMLAFRTAAEGLHFANDVQEALSAEDRWPAGLSRPGTDDGFGLLSVSIGVDYGDVLLERSTLTGRMEYFGPTVVHARWAEQVGVPGAVAATEAVLDEVPDDAEIIVIPHSGASRRRGAMRVWAVLPTSRASHEAFVRQHCSGRALPSMVSSGVAASRFSVADDTASLSEASTCSRRSFMAGSVGASSVVHHRAAGGVVATVGVIKYSSADADTTSWEAATHSLSGRLASLHAHLEATGGHVSTVLNDLALVSWGVHGACTQHINESTRFLLRLHSGAAETRNPFHAGLATGPVACGTVAPASDQLHVTVIGPCVDAALMLCAAAAEAEAAALVLSMPRGIARERYERSDFLQGHLWPVDTWTLWPALGADGAVTVYELHLSSAAAAAAAAAAKHSPRDVRPSLTGAREEGNARALEEYKLAYARRDVEGVVALAGQFASAPAVADRLRREVHLPHALAVIYDAAFDDMDGSTLSMALSDQEAGHDRQWSDTA